MVRSNELAFARRGALNKLAARRQGARPSQITAVLVGLDPADSSRVIVSFDGSEVSVLSGPHKLVPGSLVAVEVDSANAPVRVAGPVTTRPEGLDPDVEAPAPVTPMPAIAPRELTEAEAQAITDTSAGLADAQDRLADAEGLLDALDAADGPAGVAAALTDYLAIPLDQITVVDNRGPDGQVVANLYDAIIVDGLLTAENVITSGMAVDGFLEARHLNVVPETGSGGVEILPPGIRIIPAGELAGTAVSLRTDEPNWLSFAQDGVATFSVSPEGELVAQDISANANLFYRGAELTAVLDNRPLGLVSQIAAINQNAPMQTGMRGMMSVRFTNATTTTRVVKVTAKLKVRARDDNIQLAFYGEASTASETIQATLGSPVRSVGVNATSINGASTIEHVQFFKNAPGQTWSVLVGAKSNNTTTDQLVFRDENTRMWAEDIGPWIEPVFDVQTPDLRGSSTDGTVATKTYTTPWNSNGFQTFPASGYRHVRAPYSVVQGTVAGVTSTGHWYFPSLTAALSGATMNSGTLTIRNQHAYSSSGMVASVWAHGYASSPGSFGTASKIGDFHVAKGGDLTITLSASSLAGLKSGSIRGFGLSGPDYGYFSPDATLRLTYTK